MKDNFIIQEDDIEAIVDVVADDKDPVDIEAIVDVVADDKDPVDTTNLVSCLNKDIVQKFINQFAAITAKLTTILALQDKIT